MKNTKVVQLLISTATDEAVAVAELKQQLQVENIAAIIFFCSSYYKLEKLGSEFNQHFSCDVIGCTSAGEISGKYYSNSLVALALSKDSFAVHSTLIDDVQNFHLADAMKISNTIESELNFSNQLSSTEMFGFLLTDGLSLKEEKVTSLLYQVLGDINIIGGSAGDDLELIQTYIYFDKQFHINSAVIMVIEVLADFSVFRLQHFEPTDKEVITTEVDFEQRIVKEINGEPAALAYAKINDLDPKNLNSLDFAIHPLMIQIADEWYIRSISNVNPDNSLQFYCAIDYGLPLSIARSTDVIRRLEQEVETIEKEYSEIYCTLGCDCIFRRLEFSNKGYTEKIEALLNRINFIGFNSYGEQFNGIHFNQTLVGVVIGKKVHG